MMIVQLTASLHNLPAGATLSVESLSSLDQYSARGFFNLNLSNGKTLHFLDVFTGLDVVTGDLMTEIQNSSPSP